MPVTKTTAPSSRAEINLLALHAAVEGKDLVLEWMLDHDMEPSATARRADDYAWARELIRENKHWSSYKLAEVKA